MRKVAFTVLKVIIVATSIAYLYLRLTSEDLDAMTSGSFIFKGPIPLLYLGVFMLFISVGSWWFEAAKWKLLFQKEISLSTLQSLKIVLIALAGGTLTPGKIGEYGLRVAVMPKSFRKEAPGKHEQIWICRVAMIYFYYTLLKANPNQFLSRGIQMLWFLPRLHRTGRTGGINAVDGLQKPRIIPTGRVNG